MLQRRAGNLRRPISIKITLNPSSPSHNFPPNHYWLDPSNQIALLLSEVRDWPPMLIIQFANWSASLRVVSHLHRLLRFKDCLDSGRLMAEIARRAWITIIALGKDDISRTFSNSSRSKAFQSCWLPSSPKSRPRQPFLALNFISSEWLLRALTFLYFVPPYLRMRPYEGGDHQQGGSPIPMELQLPSLTFICSRCCCLAPYFPLDL